MQPKRALFLFAARLKVWGFGVRVWGFRISFLIRVLRIRVQFGAQGLVRGVLEVWLRIM